MKAKNDMDLYFEGTTTIGKEFYNKYSLLYVARKYTYEIFRNGNDEISIEVELTKDFKKVTTHNYAIVSIPVETFNRLTESIIRRIFNQLRIKIEEYGAFFVLDNNYYIVEAA